MERDDSTFRQDKKEPESKSKEPGKKTQKSEYNKKVDNTKDTKNAKNTKHKDVVPVNAEKSNIHAGHRERMRQKYINNGIESFADHEILELLLFYCIPVKNTNDLAHKLLNEFKSLYSLMNASPLEVSRKCKVSEQTAVLISLIPSVYKRYSQAKWPQKVNLLTMDSTCQYAVSLFNDEPNECFYMICMDSQRRLITPAFISKGTLSQVQIQPRHIIETAIKYSAANVVFTHNHPGATLTPSKEDIVITRTLINILSPIDVRVTDHIIVSGKNYYSFAEFNLLNLSNM